MAISLMSGPPSTAARLTHSLLPSLISGLLSVILGVGIVLLWLLASSVNFGTFLPDWFDGYLGAEYTNNVVRPILVFINQPLVNTILLLLGWGLLGVVVYGLIELTVHAHRAWREAHNNIQIVALGVVVHPGDREFLGAFVLRSIVVISIVIALFFVLPQLAQHTGSLAPRIVTGEVSLRTHVPELATLAAYWTLFAHFWVVAIRLLLLRPRIF